MDKKRAIVLVALLVVGAGAALVVAGIVPNPLAQLGANEPIPDVETYVSTEHRLAFGYPSTHALREIPLTNEGTNWSAITLADKEVLRQAEENGASEGPPLIAIQIFDNAANQTAEEWVRSSKFSNFNLSINGVLATTSVAGVDAVAYVYSGLFATDVVVAARGGKMYMFLVDWIAEDDANRNLFDRILDSVQFI
jgi:hypothetical protein